MFKDVSSSNAFVHARVCMCVCAKVCVILCVSCVGVYISLNAFAARALLWMRSGPEV
jgi:hypothetical protein